MKRITSIFAVIAALAAGLIPAAPGQAATKTKEHRIVFQVDQNNPALMNLVLNNVANTLKYYHDKDESVRIEMVAYGPGLNMLRQDRSPVKARLRGIKDAAFPSSVQFSACHNTMMGMQRKEGHPIPIVSEATIVPSGVVRLNELQEEGWSYIRP